MGHRSLSRAGLMLAPALLLFACHDSSSSSGVTLSGAQTGVVSIDPATGKVTVTTKPQAFAIKGSAVVAPAPVGVATMTVTLELTNKSKQVIHNPKLLVTNLSEGTDSGADGTYDSDPYYYFGPMALAKNGGKATRDIVINGPFTADVTFDLEVVFHPTFYVTDWSNDLEVNDSSGTQEGDTVDGEALGFDGENLDSMGFHAGVSGPDGRYVYMGMRNQPAIARLDTTTHALTLSGNLVPGPALAFDGTGPIGACDGVTLSPDSKYLYAVVNDGAHTYDGSEYATPTIWVVKVARSNMSVVKRVAIQTPPAGAAGAEGFVESRGRTLSISADGTRGAVCVTRSEFVHLVDLSSMTLLDSFDVNPLVTEGGPIEVRSAAISPDGTTIYCAYIGNTGDLAVVDTVADGGISFLSPPTASSYNYSTALSFGPDGRLYYGRHFYNDTGGLSIYDPSPPAEGGGSPWIEIAEVQDCYSLAFSADGTKYYAYNDDDGTVYAFDMATDAVIPNPANGADERDLYDYGYGHCFVVTP